MTWTLFWAEFLKRFTMVVRKTRAELLLWVCMQHSNKGVVVFVEEMMRLLRRVDPKTTEHTKQRFLVRGVRQELHSPPQIEPEFLSKAATIEPARWRIHCEPRQYSWCHNGHMHETIHAAVREEPWKLFLMTLQP